VHEDHRRLGAVGGRAGARYTLSLMHASSLKTGPESRHTRKNYRFEIEPSSVDFSQTLRSKHEHFT
jgi:hypothetical protein